MSDLSAIPPPHSLDSEQAVLGALLLDPSLVHGIEVILKPADFYHERHRHIYEAIITGFQNGHGPALDLLTLADALERRGTLDAAGGRGYLTALPQAVVTPRGAPHHAAIVRRKAELRTIMTTAREMLDDAQQDVEDPHQIIRTAETRLRAIHAETAVASALSLDSPEMQTALAGYHAEYDSLTTGLPTPWRSVNEQPFRLYRESLITLKAVSKAGKTSTAAQIIMHAAAHLLAMKSSDRILAIFTEDTERQILERIVSQHLLIPRGTWHHPPVPQWAIHAMTECSRCILPALHVDIKTFLGGCTADQIENVIAKVTADGARIALLVIDYAQNIDWPGVQNHETNHAEKNCRRFYRWIETLGCTILNVAQDKSARGENATARAKNRRAGNQRVYGGDGYFRRSKAFIELDLGDPDPADKRAIIPVLLAAARGSFNREFEIELDWAPRYGLTADFGTLHRLMTRIIEKRRHLNVPEDAALTLASAKARLESPPPPNAQDDLPF